jgi:hypothetical protein
MFRHTFSTWLEDLGIPTRVIAELMGHRPGGTIGRTSRAAPADHNAVTAGYTHTTPAMLSRVLAAIEERLETAFAVAAKAPACGPAPGRRTGLDASAAMPDRRRTGRRPAGAATTSLVRRRRRRPVASR